MGIPSIPPSSSLADYRDSLRSRRKSILDSSRGRLRALDSEESEEISYDDFHSFHEQLLKQEDEMRKTVEKFACEVEAPIVTPSVNQAELINAIAEEKKELESLEWQVRLELTRKKAKLLTKCFWTEIKKLSNNEYHLTAETFQEMNQMFRKIYEDFSRLLHEAPKSKDPEIIVSRFEELEVKEDLLLSSLELRKEYAKSLKKSSEHQSMMEAEENLKKHPIRHLLKALPQPKGGKAEQIIERYLEKKRVTNPEVIADFSLYLASMTPSSKIHPSMSHQEIKAAGITGGVLSLIFGLPSAILAARAFTRDFSAYSNQKRLEEETHEVQHVAHALKEEGQTLAIQGQKILLISEDNEEIEQAHQLMKSGHRLEAIGIEIEQKTKTALEELHRNAQKAPQKLMTISLACFSESAKTLFGVSEILNHAERGFETLPISHALHAVGIAGGIGGVIVGGIQSYHSFKRMQDLERKITTAIEKNQKLSLLAHENPEIPQAFILLEARKNDEEFLRAKIDYGFAQISFANSLVLIVAGIIGVVALIAIPASGGLSIAVIVIVGSSSIVSIIQFFRRRHALGNVEKFIQEESKQAKALYKTLLKEIQQMQESTDEFIRICEYYKIKQAERGAFRRSPVAFLKNQYKGLLHEQE